MAKKAGKAKGLFIEFCCKETSPVCKIADSLGISYLGVTKECLNAEDGDAFQQLLLWVQDEIQQEKCPVHLWGSLRGGSVSFEWSHHSEGGTNQKYRTVCRPLGCKQFTWTRALLVSSLMKNTFKENGPFRLTTQDS